jgi:hypothetical protein
MVRVSKTHGLIVTSLIGIAVSVLSFSGCSSKSGSSACHAISGGCAGVPDGNICGGAACTDGVTCANVVNAKDDGELQGALASATAGACIALTGSTYGDAALPGGVSLLGRGASVANVHSVTVNAGMGAVVRGVTVGGGGITIANGAAGVRVDSVHVLKPDANAITLGTGSSATIVSSTLEGAGSATDSRGPLGGNAIYAAQAAGLDIEKTYITSTYGPGIWAQSCTDGCTCTATAMKLNVHGIIIEGAELVAMALGGVNATIDDVTLTGTIPFHRDGQQGGGLAAFQCTNLTATNFRSTSNMLYGVLVDHSSAQIGDANAVGSVDISDNKTYGAWIQNISTMQGGSAQGVSLSGARLKGNQGVGIGLDGNAQGIIIEGCESTGTGSKTLPTIVPGPGQASVGDGLLWGKGVQANVKSLTVDGNARAGATIGGQWADGSNMGLEVGNGNAHGIIIEGIPIDVAPPSLNVDGSLVTRTATYDFPLPVGPAAPTAIRLQ